MSAARASAHWPAEHHKSSATSLPNHWSAARGWRVIEVDEHFEVAAPAERVWQVLADPHAVVGCVPGASIVSENEDGSLETALGVQFGPLRIAFAAHAELELDRSTRQGRIVARGRDKQGGARFTATAQFNV